jgi:transglutaminase-like putative cysteine protease
LWTKELDRALAEGEIDCAVHSMKDVETIRPDAIRIAAMLPRADVRDRLVGVGNFAALPPQPIVGTSSPRRAAQVKRLRPDAQIILFRGNVATRLTIPPGNVRLSCDFVIEDSGDPDQRSPSGPQMPVEELPDAVMPFLLGSRYCETDLLSDTAWDLFGWTTPGWPRVQAICDYVHNHIRFGYGNARATRTAAEAHAEGVGVCRDYTHLAVAFCRCMNIPTRYCTGYISEVGVAQPIGIMDFAAWMECWLDGQWWTFDPRNNRPRIGRVLVAQGRDAADVPLTHTFGPNNLTGFHVTMEPIG